MSETHSNFLALDLDNGCYDEFESYQSDDEERLYDALNDETFGNLADQDDMDWELQHETFLRNEKSMFYIDENREPVDQLEHDLKHNLNIEDEEINEINIEDSFSSSIWRVDEAELQKQKESENFRSLLNKLPFGDERKSDVAKKKQFPKNILSVEELEKQLRTRKQPQQQPPPSLFPYPPPPVMIPSSRMNTFVPILLRPPPPPPPPFQILPRFVSGAPLVYNTPPPPLPSHLLLPTMTKSNNVKTSPSSSHSSISSLTKNSNDVLLTNHEKQWLLNVQFVQLNTLTPFIDDYYYYAFQEEKRKAAVQSVQNSSPHKTKRDIDEEWHLIKHRMYSSIQFNNSLGKLSTSGNSFMCPRKFLEFDTNNQHVKTTRNVLSENHRYRLVLLEIELFYNQLLYFEDLKNPLMVLNLKRQKEIVEKQHLKEIETAVNVEEALLKFQKELKDSASQFEAPETILNRILTNFLSKERIPKFLMIRKGKSFILRLIKHAELSKSDNFLTAFWFIFLQLNLTPIWKRDVANQDNQMRSFYVAFNNFIKTCEIDVIQQIIRQVNSSVNPSKSRALTIKVSSNGIQQSRCRLQTHNLLGNTIGLSCVSLLIIQVEYLLLLNELPKTDTMIWDDLLVNLNESLIILKVSKNMARPYEPIPRQVINTALDRIFWLDKTRTEALVNCFV